MSLFRFAKKTKPIADRCREDAATRLRLRYAPYYHHAESQQRTTIRLGGRELIMLSSNDYLGLAWHPEVIEASARAVRDWGTSTTGARLANGSRAYHAELEGELAAFIGKESCHVSVAGYISCLSAIAAFAQKGDIVIVDRNIHSCMWDGVRLSGAQVERFSHNNPEDLRRLLESLDPEAPKLLAIEGVYSMEGHLAQLPQILDVAEDFGCFVVLDDAHGFGVLGPDGAGTPSHFGVTDRVDIICGSLSKSLASTGGFVAGTRSSVEFLRTHSKQTIFSAALSPGQAAAARAALRVLRTEPVHRERLWKNTERYRGILLGLGLDTWGSMTPALPIVLGAKEVVYKFWQTLLDEGVFSVMSIAPGVPPGKDLVRTAVSAGHTDAQLDQVAEAMRVARSRTLG